MTFRPRDSKERHFARKALDPGVTVPRRRFVCIPFMVIVLRVNVIGTIWTLQTTSVSAFPVSVCLRPISRGWRRPSDGDVDMDRIAITAIKADSA